MQNQGSLQERKEEPKMTKATKESPKELKKLDNKSPIK